MNCQEALALLYDIIDKEASQIDTQQVHEHLQKCSHCLKRYELEGDVNAFVKERLSHSQPTQQLTSLRSKILCKLDHIDHEEGGLKDHKSPFWKTSYLIAAAALLVVTVSAAYFAAEFYRHQDLYLPLEEAHWATTGEPGDYHDPTETSAAVAFVDSIGYSLSTDVKNEHLIGGYVTEIDGARMAHFVYANSDFGEAVSVFVVPADRFHIPDNLKTAMVKRHGLNLFDHNCRGCRLVYHQVGNAVVITATTDHATELLDFIPDQSSI
jgi:anti-sigma factor (TIGR02949 family)